MAITDHELLPFPGPTSSIPRSEEVRGNDETLRKSLNGIIDDVSAGASSSLLSPFLLMGG